jgi:hypothetical protein
MAMARRILPCSTGRLQVDPCSIPTESGDYDGDGKYDLAVFRPGDGTWYIRQSSEDGDLLAVEWGLSTDIPVPGDYDGDGKFDVAVFRPSTSTWYVLRSSNAQSWIVQFGGSTDTPVPSLYVP